MKDDLGTIESADAAKAAPGATRPDSAAKSNAPAPGAANPSPSSSTAPRPARKAYVPAEEEDEPTFLQRFRIPLIIGGVVLLGGGWMMFGKSSGKSAPPRREPPPMMVKIQPLPPPPPTPPPPPPKIQPPPKDEKLPEQAPMAAPDKKPEAPKPKPVDKPPEGLGTNIKGPGAGTSGLGSGSGSGMIGGTGNGPGGGGSAGAWYAGQVQTRVADAIRNNRKTRDASLRGIKFTVGVDATGRVTSCKLLSSTGDTALDAAIQNEALNGLRLQEPPPGGKPMTVTMVLNATRPK